MRTAITLGRRHGAKELEIIHLPSVSVADQMAKLKAARGSKTHSDFEHVEVWESDAGLTRKQRFSKPESEPEPVKKGKKNV